MGRADACEPAIRARNREKAKILIGSREPVITNSVTPTSAGPTVVTGSVQYLDVGLTLEVEPTVHLDNQVSIKMNLEVSSILKQVTTSSGTIAYEIGTRNAQTLLSLKDGETQILAGLIQTAIRAIRRIFRARRHSHHRQAVRIRSPRQGEVGDRSIDHTAHHPYLRAPVERDHRVLVRHGIESAQRPIGPAIRRAVRRAIRAPRARSRSTRRVMKPRGS